MSALPKGSREPFGKGALFAVDLALVDRIWREMPVTETLRALQEGTLKPHATGGAVPGQPIAQETRGLDVAIRAMTTRKSLGLPLVRSLQAKRALKAPWRWLTSIPDLKEETRLDDRLLRLAEVTRLPDLAAEEILAVGSVVEREMIGAGEIAAAFGRWGSPSFGGALEKTDPDQVGALLEETWGDPAPLLAAMGLDEEEELARVVGRRLRELGELSRFARANALALLPWSREGWPAFLQERAMARAR